MASKKNKDVEPTELDYGVGSDEEPDGEFTEDVEEQEAEQEQEEIVEKKSAISTKNLKEKYEYKPTIRTEIIFVAPENRVTSELMTKFEYTDVVGQRAKQIEKGGPVFTDVTGLTDPIAMAEKEISDKKCPLDIIRMLSENIAERWHVNEMATTLY